MNQDLRENAPFHVGKRNLFAIFQPTKTTFDEVEQMEFLGERLHKATDCVHQSFDKLLTFTPECPNPFQQNRMYSNAEIVNLIEPYTDTEIVAAANGCKLGVDLGRVLPALCMEFEKAYVTPEYPNEPTNFVLICTKNTWTPVNHCIAVQKLGTRWIWYDSATNVATKFRTTPRFYEFLRNSQPYTVKVILCVEPRPFPY